MNDPRFLLSVYTHHDFHVCLIYLSSCCVCCTCVYREEHIEKKIEGMVKEAKAKMAKGDKKGNSFNCGLDMTV